MARFKVRVPSGVLHQIEVEPSDTIDDVKRTIRDILRIQGSVTPHFPGMARKPLDSERLLDLYPDGSTTIDVDVGTLTTCTYMSKETVKTQTIYENNTSLNESTQVNGPVNDGDGPSPTPSDNIVYISNTSKDSSIQVNGPVSSKDLFKRRNGSS